MGKIILVTGGARSGKSSFAEAYAAKRGRKIAYIATAEIRDAEMADRVELHRQRRPDNWSTYEAPFGADRVLARAAADHDMILFDCLTLYLSNALCQRDTGNMVQNRTEVLELFARLIEAAKNSPATTVFVTNEVGGGIVPENALARAYRDLSGSVNQLVAANAEAVYLVVAGLPVELKKIAENLGE